MSLWMVIYAAGKIGGVIGPLPYDMVECRERLAIIGLQATKPLSSVGMAIHCEFHDQRPTIDPSLADPPR
jgi:hypothetical protein